VLLESLAVRDSTVRWLSRLHLYLYRLTGGVVGRRLVRNDMLLLTTRRRTSGRSHTVPLLFLHDGDTLVVIASYGGRPDHPDWYRNLCREPRAVVQIGRTKQAVRARAAADAERVLWWPRIVAAYPGYRSYQSRTDRVIPVVFLEPVSAPVPPQS
jgi:deazaflavin-dependent oxidoreductase (nitroreductase family)